MSVLVTGGNGFLGTALTDRLLAQGHKVYCVSRHAPELREGLVPLRGDILVPDFGLREILAEANITAVYHLAAAHRLGEDKDGSIWDTNVAGTRNVIKFCIDRAIPHLYHCSTAYTAGRNTYELSKAECEKIVNESGIPTVTIFKPSIIMGTEHFFPGHFAQFISLLVRVHKRAEIVRRKIEGSLRLPVIEPVFRIRGNPEGRLNLVTVDEVAGAMARVKDPGQFWLTHPSPPALRDIVTWTGEYIMVDLRIEPEFKPTPLEAAFQKLGAAFLPYLWGDNFKSNLQLSPPIDKAFIQETVKRIVLD